MRKWFCTLVLVVFATNIGLSGGMAASPTKHVVAAVEADSVSGTREIVKTVSRCCMDTKASSQSGTTRCWSDCSYSVSNTQSLLVPAVQDHRDRSTGSEWPRYAGTVFRPPIA